MATTNKNVNLKDSSDYEMKQIYIYIYLKAVW